MDIWKQAQRRHAHTQSGARPPCVQLYDAPTLCSVGPCQGCPDGRCSGPASAVLPQDPLGTFCGLCVPCSRLLNGALLPQCLLASFSPNGGAQRRFSARPSRPPFGRRPSRAESVSRKTSEGLLAGRIATRKAPPTPRNVELCSVWERQIY